MGTLTELVEAVPALSGRVSDAAAFSTLRARNQLGHVSHAAYVLPLGLQGGKADAASGLFRQDVRWLWGVVLVVRAANEPTGAAALIKLTPLITAVIEAVAGAEDEAGFGVFTVARGEFVSLDAGLLIFQLDFAIDDQLRISR